MNCQTDLLGYIKHHKHFLEQIPGYFGLATLDVKYAFSNKRTANLLGFKDLDTLIGVDFYNVKCGIADDAEPLINQNHLIVRKETSITSLGFHGYYEKWKVVICEKYPLYDFNSKVIGVFMQWMDITNYNLVDSSRFISNTIDNSRNNKKTGFSYVFDDGGVNDYKLSERQIECLFYLIRGHSLKDIGSILHISPRTVESYINEIKIKMNCRTKKEIIEKSFNEGLSNTVPKSFLKY